MEEAIAAVGEAAGKENWYEWSVDLDQLPRLVPRLTMPAVE
jgi:hypothetical protein